MVPPESPETQRLQQLRAIGRLREAYAEAVLSGAESQAEGAIREALEFGLGEGAIDDGIIAPVMRRVGEQWASGAISVADEHLATMISTRMIALQREAFRVAARRADHRIMLCAIQEERHIVGLEMAASVLGNGGYDVLMLGADVPITTLAQAVERHHPAIVGFSATLAANAKILPAAIYEVRAADPAVGIIIGGAAASLRMDATAGTAVCTHVTDAVQIADALIQRAALN
jgi:methanogenic corrinoid protein MtbC1